MDTSKAAHGNMHDSSGEPAIPFRAIHTATTECSAYPHPGVYAGGRFIYKAVLTFLFVLNTFLGILWAVLPNDIPGQVISSGLYSDAKGDLYVFGTFTDRLDFGSISITSKNEISGFLAKKEVPGNWLWAKQFQGSHPLAFDAYPMRSAVLDDGRILVMGPLSGMTGTEIRSEYGKVIKVSTLILDLDGNPLPSDPSTSKYIYQPPALPGCLCPDPDWEQEPILESRGRLYSWDSPDIDGDAQGSAAIKCVDNVSSQSWELKINARWKYIRTSSGKAQAHIDNVVLLDNMDLLILGVFTGDYASVGSVEIAMYTESEDSSTSFLACIDANGTAKWAASLPHYVRPSWAGCYLFRTSGGLTVCSYTGRVDFDAAYISDVYRNIYYYDAKGNNIGLDTIGNWIESGNSYIQCGDNGELLLLSERYGYVSQGPPDEEELAVISPEGIVTARYSFEAPQGYSLFAMKRLGQDKIVTFSSQRQSYQATQDHIIIACYDVNMNPMWEKVLSGAISPPDSGWRTSPSDFAEITVLSDGILMQFAFSGSVLLDSADLRPGVNKGFMSLKINAAGETVWVHKVGYKSSPQPDFVSSYVASSGEYYLYGRDNYAISFPSSVTINDKGNSFIAKFDPNGEFCWVRRFDYSGYRAMLCSNDAGDVFFGGQVNETSFRIGDKSASNTSGFAQFYLAILGANGDCVRIKKLSAFDKDTRVSDLGCMACFDGDKRLFLALPYGYEGYANLYTYSVITDKLTKATMSFPGLFYVDNMQRDTLGRLYIFATHDDWHGEGGFSSGFIIAMDIDLNLLWKKNLITKESYVDAEGNIYFRGAFSDFVDVENKYLTSGLVGGEEYIGRISDKGKVDWLRRCIDFE